MESPEQKIERLENSISESIKLQQELIDFFNDNVKNVRALTIVERTAISQIETSIRFLKFQP